MNEHVLMEIFDNIISIQSQRIFRNMYSLNVKISYERDYLNYLKKISSVYDINNNPDKKRFYEDLFVENCINIHMESEWIDIMKYYNLTKKDMLDTIYYILSSRETSRTHRIINIQFQCINM